MPTTWRNRSACLDESPELFFPIGNTGPALDQIEEAKAVCARCEVVEACLSWAVEGGQDAGVWGGLSEEERRATKRRNARVRASSRSSAGSVAPLSQAKYPSMELPKSPTLTARARTPRSLK